MSELKASESETQAMPAESKRLGRLGLLEVSGSLGDLGTFLPLWLGMVTLCGLDPGVSLVFAGAANEATLKEAISKSGLNALMWPSVYIQVDEIPTLGSGKCDFSAARRMAVEHLGGDA